MAGVRSVGWGVLAFIMGMLPVFGLAGHPLFAEGPVASRAGAVLLSIAGMAVLAIGGGAIAGEHRLALAIGLVIPVVPALLLTSWNVSWAPLLAAVLVVGDALAVWLGTAAGSRLTAAVLARRAGR